jgi:hypothetical protein
VKETKEVTLADRCEVLKRFVESESIRGKVCYDTQESLKPILALYPRYAGTTSTRRLALHTNRSRVSELNFPLSLLRYSGDAQPGGPQAGGLCVRPGDEELRLSVPRYELQRGPEPQETQHIAQRLGQHQALLSWCAQATPHMYTSNLHAANAIVSSC